MFFCRVSDGGNRFSQFDLFHTVLKRHFSVRRSNLTLAARSWVQQNRPRFPPGVISSALAPHLAHGRSVSRVEKNFVDRKIITCNQLNEVQTDANAKTVYVILARKGQGLHDYMSRAGPVYQAGRFAEITFSPVLHEAIQPGRQLNLAPTVLAERVVLKWHKALNVFIQDIFSILDLLLCAYAVLFTSLLFKETKDNIQVSRFV